MTVLLPSEPLVSINGTTLSPAQAAVVRVAIENMGLFLNDSPAKADADLGQELADAYRGRVKQLQRMMYSGRPRR